MGLETASAKWLFFNGTSTVADKLNPGVPAGVSAAVNSTTSVNIVAVLRGDVVSSSSAYTYNWSLTSKPTGSNASITDTSAVNPSFKADVAGDYKATVTITDGSKNTSTSSVTLTACNASSNTSSPFSGCSITTNTEYVLTGIAATGAPMANALITVFDSTGAIAVEGVKVGANGAYSLTIPAGKSAPFTLVADDGVDKVVSVLGSNTNATVNINQVTDLVAAHLSPSGNPLNLPNEIAKATTIASASKISSSSSYVQTALQPLYSAVGVSSFDPFTVVHSTDGKGVDKALDMLDIKITPSGAMSNVEITVKGAMDEDKPANSVSQGVLGNGTSPGLSTLPTVSSSDVVPDGTSVLIKNLLDKMTACWALSKSERVGSGTSASSVIATACKEIFIGQNPVNYKHGGSVVSSTQHFSGLFSSSVGVTFERPQYFGMVKTDAPVNGPKAGDMLIGYRWTDAAGNFQYERVMVRKNASNGRLEVVGNQYLHDGGVGSFAQRRTNVRNDAMSYYSVGYTPTVFISWSGTTPRVVGSLKPIKHLKVTSPTGKLSLLCPYTGYSFLVYAKDQTSTCEANATNGTLTGTNFVRVRSEYVSNTTSTHPNTKDTALWFATTESSEDDLAKQVSTKPWTFEYTFSDATTATQYHRPSRRAYTITELKAVPLPALTDTRLQSLKASRSDTTTPGKGYGSLDAAGFKLDWVGAYDDDIAAKKPVPFNAAPMTAVRIFGGSGLGSGANGGFSGSFEDRVVIKSTLRTFTIKCPINDKQCDAGTTNYATTSKTVGTDLYTRTSDGIELVHFYSLTYLTP